MSLPAVSLGDRFCASRGVGQAEVGGFTHGVKTTWLCLGLAIESP